jgi:hypothetical protein
MALADVFKTKRKDTKKKLRIEVLRSLRKREHAQVMVGRELGLFPSKVKKVLHKKYRLSANVSNGRRDRHLRPKTGYAAIPKAVYAPGPQPETPAIWVAER